MKRLWHELWPLAGTLVLLAATFGLLFVPRVG